MAFKNVGTFDLGRAASGAARGGNAAVFSLDADGIASGQAFLTSELEKRDMMVRTPLTSFTYARDIPVRVGGGWAETVSAMQVGYGIAGGSGDGIVHAGGSCRAAFSELRRYYRPEIEKRLPSRSYKLSDHLSILQAGSGKTARKIALPVPAPSSPGFTSGQAGAPKRQQPNMEAGSGLQTAETSGSPRVGRNDRRP